MTEAETAPRVRAALDALGWESNAIADHLGIRDRKMRRWISGKEACPPWVVAWLEAKADQARAGADMSEIADDDLPEGW